MGEILEILAPTTYPSNNSLADQAYKPRWDLASTMSISSCLSSLNSRVHHFKHSYTSTPWSTHSSPSFCVSEITPTLVRSHVLHIYIKFILAGKKKYIELCCLVSLEIHDQPTQVVFKPPTNHSRVSCFAQSPGLLGDYFKHLLSLLIPWSCSSAGDLAF